MVHGYSRGDCLLHLVSAVRNILYIYVCRDRSERNDRIQHIICAAYGIGYIFRKYMMSKAIKETDYYKNQGIGYHHCLIADPVYDPPDHGSKEVTGYG